MLGREKVGRTSGSARDVLVMPEPTRRSCPEDTQDQGVRPTFLILVCAALLLLSAASAQVQYARGQNVAPVFEGWERNADGSYNLVFGYLNRNYDEQVDIPIGPENHVDLGDDQGQPTHFYPRRQRFVFRVTVPR